MNVQTYKTYYPLAGLIAGFLLVWAFFILPQITTYFHNSAESKKLVTQLEKNEKTLEKLKEQIAQNQERKAKLSAPAVQAESLLFPKKINTGNIAQTLELLALQLSAFDTFDERTFELESATFAPTQNQAKKPYATTKTNLKFKTHTEYLRAFISYLQTGAVPEIIEHDQAQPESRRVTPLLAYQELKNNVLPIATIDSLQFSQQKDSEFFEVQMQVSFYSQRN